MNPYAGVLDGLREPSTIQSMSSLGADSPSDNNHEEMRNTSSKTEPLSELKNKHHL